MKRELHKRTIGVTSIMLTLFFSVGVFGQVGDNLLPNAGFEDGIGKWSIKTLKDGAGTKAAATLELDGSNARSGSSAGKVTITEPTTDDFKVTIFSDTIYNAELGQYLFSAWVKTAPEADSNGIFKLSPMVESDAGAKQYPGGETFSGVSTVYQEYKILVSLRVGYLYKTLIRGQFDKVASIIYLDDATVQQVTDFFNGGFEDEYADLFGWSTSQVAEDGATAVFSKESTDVYEGSGALKVEVTGVSDTINDISVTAEYDHFLDNPAVQNAYTFYAKSSNDGDSIWASVRVFVDNSGKYELDTVLTDSIKLTTSWEKHTVSYMIPEGIEAIFTELRLNLGNQVTTYYFDNFDTKVYSAPVITSDPVTSATVGEEYSYQVTYDGEGEFSITSFPEASWLSIDENGLLTGTPTEPGDFGITVKLNDGANEATQSFTINVAPSTGINNNLDKQINIYPNPARNYIIIEGIGNNAVSIYDITGKQVMKQEIRNDQSMIDIGSLHTGIYVIAVSSDEKTVYRKLEVQ